MGSKSLLGPMLGSPYFGKLPFQGFYLDGWQISAPCLVALKIYSVASTLGFRQKGLGLSPKCSSRMHSAAVAADATRCFGCLVADGRRGVVEEIGVLDYIGASVGVPSLVATPQLIFGQAKDNPKKDESLQGGWEDSL